MKVQLCETVTVDVETYVDVDVNAVLMEWSRQLQSFEMNDDLPPYKTLMLPMVDFATKLMNRIPHDAIGKCTDAQRAEVVRRLQFELHRWNSIMISAEE